MNSNVKKIIFLLILFIVIAIILMICTIIYFIKNNVSSGSSVAQTSVENETTEEITDEEYEYPKFESSNVVTSIDQASEDLEYQLKVYDAIGNFSAVIDNKTVYIQAEDLSGMFDKMYPNSKMEKNGLYEVTNIDENVVDVEIGYIGTSYSNPIIIMLTEEGNVKYLKLDTENTNTLEFVASEVILTNVVRIENVLAKTDSSISMTIVLVQQNGSNYNLDGLI